MCWHGVELAQSGKLRCHASEVDASCAPDKHKSCVKRLRQVIPSTCIIRGLKCVAHLGEATNLCKCMLSASDVYSASVSNNLSLSKLGVSKSQALGSRTTSWCCSTVPLKLRWSMICMMLVCRAAPPQIGGTAVLIRLFGNCWIPPPAIELGTFFQRPGAKEHQLLLDARS